MCGIFGYIGSHNSTQICLEGLKRLEYRGYDSSGIAGIHDGSLFIVKERGKIAALEALLLQNPIPFEFAIAHTRWATHGEPTTDNAHPHSDQNNTLTIVHNGIIENHQSLRQYLKEKGISFRSETDSEVVAQLIAYLYKGNFLGAVQKALSMLQGFWGIAVIHKDHPDQIIVAARENPIAIATNASREESFISSDANAFPHDDLDVIFLRSDEVAVVRRGSVEIFDQASTKVERNAERLGLDTFAFSKGDFPHFMLKEIFDQPQAIQQALHNRCIDDYGTVEFDNLTFTAQELLGIRNILILACGTSWHAGCIAASLFEDIARISSQAEIASEFRYRNPIVSEETLVIAISQSGETLDTIAAVRETKRKGAKVLGICNVRNSTLTRECDSTLFLRAGPEISVCSTKAFTSQITVLSLFTLLMARLRHMSKEEGQELIKELRTLPALCQHVLQQGPEIEAIAKKYAEFDNFFFLGRHYMHITSLEAALKLKEISYLQATGYPSGELKHGPIALVNPELAVVGLCGNQKTYEKTLSNLTEAKSRGGKILAIAPQGASHIEDVADDVIYLPQVSDWLAAIPYSIICQLLAYYIAIQRGTEIDQPRNLAKSVTVE